MQCAMRESGHPTMGLCCTARAPLVRASAVCESGHALGHVGRGGWNEDVDSAKLEALTGGGGSGGVASDVHRYGAECASMVSFFLAMRPSSTSDAT
jgi:hypothetical protein